MMKKMSAVCDREMFLDFISQGKENVPSNGTIELKLPSHSGTVEVRLRFYSKELDKIVNATIPVTVNPQNDPTPKPNPQPPPTSGNSKLAGKWSNLNYDFAARSSDLRIMTLNEDGTFKLDLLTGVPNEYYHKGHYSVSNGKITFTNIVFVRERYNIARSEPDTVVEYEFRINSDGKDKFDLNKVLSGDNWMGGTTWVRTLKPED